MCDRTVNVYKIHMKTFVTILVCVGLMLMSAATSLADQITFQVNMSAQTALGNFDPATDGVYVAGDPVNAWSTTDSPLAPSPGNTNIWVGTFDVTGAVGSTAQYKFLLGTANGAVWEGNVGTGGGTGNRTFTFTGGSLTLPVVYFNNVTNSSTVSIDVTFQVNMSVQIAAGNFDPEAGTVSVAGEFNAWTASGFELTRSMEDTNIWVGTTNLSGALGSALLYKFVMNGGTWEGNVGSNGAQNRSLTLTSTNETLPVVYFNNLSGAATSIPITFQLDLGVQIARGNFDPANGTVSVAGDLLNNWNTSASPLAVSATDSNLWTGTFEITGTAGMSLLFKYVLNGSTWESIDNRTYTVSSTDPQTLPGQYFNNVGDLGSLSVGAVSGGQLTLSWMAGPLVRLQTAAALGAATWQDVPNSEGQASATVAAGAGRAYFRLVGP